MFMRKLLVFIALLNFTFSSFSQKKDKVLVAINGEKTTVSEFKRVYEKNLDAIDTEEAKNVENNLELFINYKLKVAQAYAIQLDTLASYQREMETYRNQLSAPYLQDSTFVDALVEEAYFRTKNEVKASHILIKVPQNATSKDTLKAYATIRSIRNRILNGEAFATVAKETSEDPSAKRNGGNLGYFSAFRMVYPFEDAAYSTKKGALSDPFRTRFGYHILGVDDFRASRGEIEVAHILISDTTSIGKKTIDKVYNRLQNNEKFETLAKQYSNDPGSKDKGGRLNKFGSGRMVEPFDVAAFNLSEINSFSTPIKTPFGWHIIKLLKKYPVPSFEAMKQEITTKVKKSGRMQLSDKAMINKLEGTYDIVDDVDGMRILERKNMLSIPKDSLQNTLFRINDKKIQQIDFVNYARNRRHKSIPVLFNLFKEDQVFAYYKENLIHTEPEYAHILKEYEDGLLLYELMQQKIWNASTKDSIGLQKYFDQHIGLYKSKELKEVKGEVLNDYQTYLEYTWMADLRKKSAIKVNKKQLKKLVKFYQKK
jgi:peptidyl-prolyl cis-trans isomerase SurA